MAGEYCRVTEGTEEKECESIETAESEFEVRE